MIKSRYKKWQIQEKSFQSLFVRPFPRQTLEGATHHGDGALHCPDPLLSRSALLWIFCFVGTEIISKNTGDEHLVSFVYLSEGARQALLGVCVFRSGGVSGPQRELFSCCGLGRPQAAPQQVLILPAVLSLG